MEPRYILKRIIIIAIILKYDNSVVIATVTLLPLSSSSTLPWTTLPWTTLPSSLSPPSPPSPPSPSSQPSQSLSSPPPPPLYRAYCHRRRCRRHRRLRRLPRHHHQIQYRLEASFLTLLKNARRDNTRSVTPTPRDVVFVTPGRLNRMIHVLT